MKKPKKLPGMAAKGMLPRSPGLPKSPSATTKTPKMSSPTLKREK